MIYFVCLITTIFLVKLLPENMRIGYGKKIKINIVPLVVAMPCLFISIFRYDVGKDYFGYVRYYYNNGTDGRNELLFSLVIKLANLLNTPHFVAAIWGIIFCIFMFYAIYRASENKLMSVVLLVITGFFFMSLSAMRQAAATAVVLFALSYLKKRDYIRFYILVGLACTMHLIAIVYAILPCLVFFIEKMSLKKQNVLKLIFVILSVLAYLQSKNIRLIMLWFSVKFGFYENAFNSIYDSGNTSGSFLFYTMPFFLICLISRNRVSSQSIEFNCYWICSALAMLCTVLLPIIPNGERIIYLFLPVEIVSVPFIINRIEGKWLRFFSLSLLIITTLTAFFVFHIKNDTFSVLDYHFYWRILRENTIY